MRNCTVSVLFCIQILRAFAHGPHNLTSCDGRAFPILPWSHHPRCSSGRRVWRPKATGLDFARSRLKVEIVILSVSIARAHKLRRQRLSLYFFIYQYSIISFNVNFARCWFDSNTIGPRLWQYINIWFLSFQVNIIRSP